VPLVDFPNIIFCLEAGSGIGVDIGCVGDGAKERSAISTAAMDHKDPIYFGDTAVVRS
jgi:hypothetical protein